MRTEDVGKCVKSNMQPKGSVKANSQQLLFELKKKVVTALNKLADRDTYQRGVEELEKTAELLAPDKISCFLSCILDTDSDQKTAVRKECIRLMGTLAKFHEGLVRPYLPKMVSSVVKRLKDPDSVVRDACLETMGVLACKIEDHNDGVFISLVKPLFEAIGDQNKYVQSGAALCLAAVIDSSPEPPLAVIQRMLTRTVKLLKNPHFMAKPAVIALNTSIIQAGGATTKNVLFSAMTSFQDALKNNDWTTRKAAAVALREIAATGEKFLGPLKTSCICSLESCRFDKVKPVRDSVVLALQYWKGVPGSCVKEECYNDAQKTSELFSTGDSKLRKKLPFSGSKAVTHYNDGHIPESSVASKMCAETTNKPELTYEYIPMDDDITVSSSRFLAAITSKQLETQVKERTSLDSTVTVSSSQVNHGCCAQIANEMASVRKQLSDIEHKQIRLIDQLQVFSTGLMDNFSALQSKVLNLEYVVEGIAQNNHGSSTISPRLSTCTCRKSTDTNSQPSTLSTSKFSNKTHARSRLHQPRGTGKMDNNPQQQTRENIWNNIGHGRQTSIKTRKSLVSPDSRHNCVDVMSGSRNHVTGVSCEDVVESEYLEMLSSGDELALVELLDRTGPVLDSMSSQTINELLSILLSYLLEQRFMNSILPWLHQVADLSTRNGANYLIPSARQRSQVLSAVQEASDMEFSNLAERRAVTQLAVKLCKLWG